MKIQQFIHEKTFLPKDWKCLNILKEHEQTGPLFKRLFFITLAIVV